MLWRRLTRREWLWKIKDVGVYGYKEIKWSWAKLDYTTIAPRVASLASSVEPHLLQRREREDSEGEDGDGVVKYVSVLDFL